MIRSLGGLIGTVLLLAACGGTPADPATQMASQLAGAYTPYAECIRAELATRTDFNGRLAEMAIEKGLDRRVQELSRRYLGASTDLVVLTPDVRVAATRDVIVALGAYGAAVDPAGTPPVQKVKRMMAVVESMHLVADIVGSRCEYPDNLQSWMKEAEDEYL